MSQPFTVNTVNMRSAATTLASPTGPAERFTKSAQKIRQDGDVGPLGFGILLAFAEVMYNDKRNFFATDLEAVPDLCSNVSKSLTSVADQYDRNEQLIKKGLTPSSLSIGGFDVTDTPPKSDSGATGGYGETNPGADVAAGAVAGLCGAGLVWSTTALSTATAALCPTYTVAAISLALFICDPLSIGQAGASLQEVAMTLKSEAGPGLEAILNNAKVGWSGEGNDNYTLLVKAISGHVGDDAEYLKTLGKVLGDFAYAMDAFWGGMLIFATAFLAWVIAMFALSMLPVVGPAFEAAAMSSGVVNGLTVLAKLFTLKNLGAAALGIFTLLGGAQVKDLAAVPDQGKSGVPDFTELKVGQTFDYSFGS